MGSVSSEAIDSASRSMKLPVSRRSFRSASSSWRSRNVGSRSTAISKVRWPSRIRSRVRRAAAGNPAVSSRGGRPSEGWVTFASLTCDRTGRHAPGVTGRAGRMSRMEPSPGPAPEPGERRRLDHPPSDRFAADPTVASDVASDGPADDAGEEAAPLSDRERVLRGVAVGLVGAIAITLLGGPATIVAGLVGAAGATGYVVGAVMRPLRVQAVAVALGSVALGLVGIWAFALLEGGVLGIVDYLADVQGFLVLLELIAAGVFAAAAS